ncbi:MAG: hypothetical protein TRG1_958 [Flavobacteriaceae bacterium FS1-H7996/R]|nr:MAG: hypothetical protein TRG1_958 [Flavobacteriaceae bacterium FS1-H7996/R]
MCFEVFNSFVYTAIPKRILKQVVPYMGLNGTETVIKL